MKSIVSVFLLFVFAYFLVAAYANAASACDNPEDLIVNDRPAQVWKGGPARDIILQGITPAHSGACLDQIANRTFSGQMPQGMVAVKFKWGLGEYSGLVREAEWHRASQQFAKTPDVQAQSCSVGYFLAPDGVCKRKHFPNGLHGGPNPCLEGQHADSTAFCWGAPSHMLLTKYPDEATSVIKIEGGIVEGDAKLFEAKIAQARPYTTIVTLNSMGGLVGEALSIGWQIHENKAQTMVGSGDVCASACADIWMAGDLRSVLNGAFVAFHAAFSKEDNQHSDGGANAAIGAYLSSLGVPFETAVKLVGHSPNDWHVITAEDDDPDIDFRYATNDAMPGTAIQFCEQRFEAVGKESTAPFLICAKLLLILINAKLSKKSLKPH